MNATSSPVSDVERQAMRLSAEQRADLAEKLWISVSDLETATDDLSDAQIEEIVRRQQRHRRGEGAGVDYRTSLQHMDQALAESRRS